MILMRASPVLLTPVPVHPKAGLEVPIHISSRQELPSSRNGSWGLVPVKRPSLKVQCGISASGRRRLTHIRWSSTGLNLLVVEEGMCFFVNYICFSLLVLIFRACPYPARCCLVKFSR